MINGKRPKNSQSHKKPFITLNNGDSTKISEDEKMSIAIKSIAGGIKYTQSKTDRPVLKEFSSF